MLALTGYFSSLLLAVTQAQPSVTVQISQQPARIATILYTSHHIHPLVLIKAPNGLYDVRFTAWMQQVVGCKFCYGLQRSRARNLPQVHQFINIHATSPIGQRHTLHFGAFFGVPVHSASYWDSFYASCAYCVVHSLLHSDMWAARPHARAYS